MAQHDPIAVPASALGGLSVLVVEDEFIIQLELESLLADAGARVVGPCRTVADALEVAEREDLDVAILDVRLGSETIAPVARVLRGRDVPFVFYTGQTGVDPILAEWPDVLMVAKPSDPDTIIGALLTESELPRGQPKSQLAPC